MDSEEQTYGVRELPPFSVEFPDHPDVYVRFSTSELATISKKFGNCGIIGIMSRLDGLDVEVIQECARLGIKTVTDHAPKPRLEAIPVHSLAELLLEAVCQRAYGKSAAQVAEEADRKMRGMVQPWTDQPKSDRDRVSLDDVSNLG